MFLRQRHIELVFVEPSAASVAEFLPILLLGVVAMALAVSSVGVSNVAGPHRGRAGRRSDHSTGT